MQSTRRIFLFGLFGGPNIGNNATLAAMLAAVRRRIPDADVTVVAPRGAEVERMFGVPMTDIDSFPIARLLWRVRNESLAAAAWRFLHVLLEPIRMVRAARLLRGADRLIVVGTGIIDEFGQTSLNLPLDVYRWTTAARRAGIPIYFVSVGVEPIRARLAQWFYTRALRTARSISVRDEFSRTQLHNLGIPLPQNAVYPDLAFSLPAAADSARAAAADRPLEVVVGIMGYRGWNRSQEDGDRIYAEYVRRTSELVRALLNRGHRVKLMLGDTRADARAVDDVRESLKGSASTANLSSDVGGEVQHLMTQFRRADVVIAARFHNLLLAFLVGCQVISISYSKKNDALMAAVGAGRFCHPIEEFTAAEVLASFDTLIMGLPEAKVDRASLIAEWRRRLESQYDSVLGANG